jgi:hypothetical protein
MGCRVLDKRKQVVKVKRLLDHRDRVGDKGLMQIGDIRASLVLIQMQAWQRMRRSFM